MSAVHRRQWRGDRHLVDRRAYLSLAPSLAEGLLGTTNHLAGGATVFALAGVGALSQVAFRGLTAEHAIQRGLLVLVAGMAATVVALSTESAAFFFAGAVLAGAGFGVAFMGAVRAVSGAAPPDHRAAVMSAFYIVAYLSLSVPAVVAGLAATSLGLETTFRVFGVGVILLALATAAASRIAAAPSTGDLAVGSGADA